MCSRKIYFLGMVLLLFCSAGVSQHFFNNKLTNNLLTRPIVDFEQDHNGFLWIGTRDHICKYDGSNLSRPNPLKHIRTKFIGKSTNNNYIWICGVNTIHLYNTVFNKIEVRKKLKTEINCAYVDKNDIIWIGTRNGILTYNKENEIVTKLSSINDKLSNQNIQSIYFSHDDELLWIGTHDKLNCINLADAQISNRIYNLKGTYNKTVYHNHITSISPYSKNNEDTLWVGTQTGLCMLDISSGKYKSYRIENSALKSNWIHDISLQDSCIWVGTTVGLYKFNYKSNNIESYFHYALMPKSLANNNVLSTFIDEAGVLWAGTHNGLCRTETQNLPFKTVIINANTNKEVTGSRISTISCNDNGTIWLGTNTGVIRYKKGKILPPPEEEFNNFKLLSNRIMNISHFNHKVYITSSTGINIWNKRTKKMDEFATQLLTSGQLQYPQKCYANSKDEFWVSNLNNGLFRCKSEKDKKNNFKRKAKLNSSKYLFTENGVWIVKDFRIFFYSFLKEKVTKSQRFRKSIKSNIKQITQYNDSIIWLGTDKELIEFNTKSKQIKTFCIKLPQDEYIANLQSDIYGNIWGSTAFTVFLLRKNTQQIEFFPLKDSSPVSRLIYHCSCKTPDGKVAFGGYDGFVIFDINSLKKINYESPVYISGLKINNKRIKTNKRLNKRIILKKDISKLDHINLKHNENSISLEFSSLHYAAPEQTQYNYILEDFEETWNTTSGTNTTANYSNLKPGNYTFKVRATNNYGSWSPYEDFIHIKITPHPLTSALAIVIYSFLFIGLIYLIFWFKTQMIRKQNQIQIIQIKAKHDEELLETKQRFFTNISHELRTPLSLIAGPLSQITQYDKVPDKIKKQANIAQRNTQRLLRLVNQILDFRKVETNGIRLRINKVDNLIPIAQNIFELYTSHAQSNEIDYKFTAKNSRIECWVDTARIETCLSNILSNAFKFTESNGKIELKIERRRADEKYKEGAVCLSISDSGVGISEEDKRNVFKRFYQSSKNRGKTQGSGIGLSMVKEYIEGHSGQVLLESQIKVGTTVNLILPLGESHLKPKDIIKPLSPKSKDINEDSVPEKHVDNTKQEKPQTILLVEDEPEIIEFIKTSLQYKYNFITAPNGKIGLDRFNNSEIDIVISDVAMPIMDGFTLCQKIKSKKPSIPVVILTAKTLLEDEIKGINCGANAYLSKPFDIGLLDAYIESLLKLSPAKSKVNVNEVISHSKTEVESVEEKILQKLVSYIELHIQDTEISNEQICNELGFSYSTLYRRIKAITNMSISEFVKSIKLKRSAQLLSKGDMNVSEVMYAVGFTSHSYFSRCFKKEFGVSPSGYVKKIINNE